MLLLPVTLVSAVAQQRADPVAIGQAKASVASARGLSALYSNIGSLAMDDIVHNGGNEDFSLEFSLFPFGASAGSTYLSESDINFVFGSKDCNVFSDEDRQRLGTLVADGKLSADVAMDIIGGRIRYRDVVALGIQYGHRVQAQMNFPGSFRNEVLGEGDVFNGEHLFSAPEVGGEWRRTFGISLSGALRRGGDTNSSAWFPSVGMGVGYQFIDGMAHFDVASSSTVRTEPVDSPTGETYRSLRAIGSYSFRTSVPEDFEAASAVILPGFVSAEGVSGSGWGATIGLSAVVYRLAEHVRVVETGTPLDPHMEEYETRFSRDVVTVGLVVEEIGHIWWNGNTLRRTRLLDSIFTDEGGGLTNEVLCEIRGDLDTIPPFMTWLPARIRVGGAVDMKALYPNIPGELLLELEGAFELIPGIGEEGAPSVSVGGAWAPQAWLTVRSGFQFGGRLGAAMAAGVGLRPFRWLTIDAATSEITSLLFQSDRSRVDVALRMTGHVRL